MNYGFVFHALCLFLTLVVALASPAHAKPANLVLDSLEIMGTRIYLGGYYTTLMGSGQSNWVLPGEIITLRATMKNVGGSDGVGSAVALHALLHFQTPTGWLPKHVYKPEPIGKPVIIHMPGPGKSHTALLTFPVQGALDDGYYKLGIGFQSLTRGTGRQDIFEDGTRTDGIWLMPHRPHLRIKEIRYRTISGGAIWQIYTAKVLIRNEGTQASWPAKLWIGIENNCQTSHTIVIPNLEPGAEHWVTEQFGYDPVFWKCTPKPVVALQHQADGTQSGGSGDSLASGPTFFFTYDQEAAFNTTPPPSPIGQPPPQKGQLKVRIPGRYELGSSKEEIIYRPNGPMMVLVDGAPPALACCTFAFERYDYRKKAWTSLGSKVVVYKAGPPAGNGVWPEGMAGKPGRYRLQAEAGKLKSDWVEFRVSEPVGNTLSGSPQ